MDKRRFHLYLLPSATLWGGFDAPSHGARLNEEALMKRSNPRFVSLGTLAVPVFIGKATTAVAEPELDAL